MLKPRVISAIVLLPLALGAIVLGDWLYALLVAVITVLAALEYAQMLRLNGYRLTLPLIWAMDLLWLTSTFFDKNAQWLEPGIVAIVLMTTAWEVLRRAKKPGAQEPTACWALTLAGGLYLGIGGAYLLRLRAYPDGLWWTLAALPIVWIADSGAYFVGKRWGNHKMAPSISPNKSWEGYAAELVSGVITGAAAGLILPIIAGRTLSLNPGNGALLGFLLAAITPIGDFFVSVIKREVRVKDSGKLIPGHGGAFDRIDSLLWTGTITCVVIIMVT